MPKQYADEHLSPTDRRREVASILAKGVVRWHRTTRTAGHLDAQESSPRRKTGLELYRAVARENRRWVGRGRRVATRRAHEAKGYNFFTERVLVCRLKDQPGELKRLSSKLADAGININYVYGACTVVLHVDDLPRTVEKLGL
jgi:hypothetical protein